MKILVTGGAGFIGSHTAERLLSQGHTVSIFDEFNDYYDPALKRRNVESVRGAGPVSLYEGSICDAGLVEQAFAETAPDAVIHLAARAGVRPSLEQPLLYEEVNVRGTMLLLEAARRHRVPRFVFASSSSIYGIANRVPFSEEDHLNLPISPYAATKIAGEKICFTYSHLYGIATICLRFFTVFGPRQRPDLAIRKFVSLIEQGKPIPVFGDGSSGRDYTFVEDTVSGIIAALHYNAPFDVFNLGNSHPVTLETMIQTIADVVGKPAIIERLPEQPGDVPITFADISKARRLLGYDPKTPFAEGVRRFYEWHKSMAAERYTESQEPPPAASAHSPSLA